MSYISKYFIAAAIVATTLAGCGNVDNEPDVIREYNCPDFTATIAGVQGRAYNQTWEPADEIGISGANRTNVRHHTSDGSGSFTVKNHGEQIYFQDENEVTFTAYYPWNDMSADAVKIAADTKDQKVEKQKSFDFLWAQATGKKTSPNVNFQFTHRMAKLSLTIKPGDGMSFDEVKAASLSLEGFCHTGSFNPANGNAVADADGAKGKWEFTGGVAPVVYDDTKQTATYSLLLFPQEFATPVAFLAELDLPGNNSYNLRAAIDFTNANRGMDGAKAKNEWVAARQYNLSLTLHKTDIKLEQCVINPWSQVDGGDITVD